MNKAELVEAIAEGADMIKKDADLILTAALEMIVDTVSQGKKVTLVGFGAFEKRHCKKREGRNPKTGETMMIAATDLPVFSAGKGLKEQVAG